MTLKVSFAMPTIPSGISINHLGVHHVAEAPSGMGPKASREPSLLKEGTSATKDSLVPTLDMAVGFVYPGVDSA